MNTWLSKWYPVYFHNKIFSLLNKWEIWNKHSKGIATIRIPLPIALCLWLTKHTVPKRVADKRKKVSHMFSNFPAALELDNKKTPELPTSAFPHLPVKQHIPSLQDVYFLPSLHKSTALSRACFVLLWFSSEKYGEVHILDVFTRWQMGGTRKLLQVSCI